MLGRAAKGAVRVANGRRAAGAGAGAARSFLEPPGQQPQVPAASSSSKQTNKKAPTATSSRSSSSSSSKQTESNTLSTSGSESGSSNAERPTNAAHRPLVERRKREQAAAAASSSNVAQLLVTNAPSDVKGKGKQTVVDGEWSSGSSGSSTSDINEGQIRLSSPETPTSSTPLSDALLLSVPSQPGPSSGIPKDLTSPPGPSFPPSSTSSSSSSCSSSSPAAEASTSSSSSPGPNNVGFLPFVPLSPVPLPQIRHPFNTNQFVSRLEQTGEFSRGTAEELMRATKALLTMAEDGAGADLVAKADLENEAYLFSAALAELRTEVQMTARTDAIALRSLNSQLQREVDSLTQKLREDINTLKNDNQLDLNNRKEEASSDISNLEQKILDINSKFTLLMGDFRAALEANKWIQTRRSIVMIAALALCVMAYVSTIPPPPPPAPPRPPSVEELGLKQIEEPDSAEPGFFSGWLSSGGGSAEKVEGKIKKESAIAAEKK